MKIPRSVVCAFCAFVASLAFGQAIDRSGASEAPPTDFAPLDEAGSGTGFQYEQIPSATNVYAVTASNGAPVLVSDSFLSLILHSGMESDIQQAALQQYPAMVQDNFGAMMESTFPVKEQAPSMPFAGIECTATDGASMTVDQDDLASPYVRIMVKDKNGRTESFSINRQFVDGLLALKETDGDKLLSSVTSFPFRLPEGIRSGFAYLTREQMDDLVLHMEAFQDQEIIRMPRFYRERAAEVMKELSNRPPRTVESAPVPAKVSAGPAPAMHGPGIVQRTSKPTLAEMDKPAAVPAQTTDRPTRNWPAIAGWTVATLALGWAILHRKR